MTNRKSQIRNRFGLGLSFGLMLSGGIGLLNQIESTSAENDSHIPYEFVAPSGKIAPLYQPPEAIITVKNGNGQEVALTIESGVPRIESRDYNRFAGFILNCYSYIPDFLIIDHTVTAARTVIAVPDGDSSNLSISHVTEVVDTEGVHPVEAPDIKAAKRLTIKYCIPAFVTETLPVISNDTFDPNGDIRQYCLEIPDSTTRPVEITKDLASCRVAF